MAKRKKLTLAVTVSVPVEMTAAQARQEVRTLINHQSNYATYYGTGKTGPITLESDDVKAVAVRPFPRLYFQY